MSLDGTRQKEAVAIIPARGGSKGIPKKNIVDLCGKPLIAYTIQAALSARKITRVVVSTEDEDIADVARAFGAEVPFLRPRELAGDTASIGDAVSYTRKRLGMTREACVQLYPTSPFRTPAFIDDMLDILFSGYSSVTTVKQVHVDPRFLFYQDKETKGLVPLSDEKAPIPGWKRYYRSYPLFLGHMAQQPEKHYFFDLTDKCMLIDVDTVQDLRWAEAVIKNNLFDFGF
ncbi:acylneuraminate cytidylyltransferase family protein [Desulfatiferula olefinivorans]